MLNKMLFFLHILTLIFSATCKGANTDSEVFLQINNAANQREVEICLRIATKSAKNGKQETAAKLYHRAFELAPQNSTVLNRYGEFLEKEDVFQADAMYQEAIYYDPTYDRAILNQRRIEPIVAKLEQERDARIDNYKNMCVGVIFQLKSDTWNLTFAFVINKNMLTAKARNRKATANQITAKALEDNGNESKNKAIAGYIWRLENLSCPNFTLRIKLGNITIADVKNIHKHAYWNIDPQQAGKFRTKNVTVAGYIPPDYNEIKELMIKFENWLNSKKSLNLSSVKYAATAHCKLVKIHPFIDGNGRTARILMNFILAERGQPAIPIKSHNRTRHYESLKTAGKGNLRPFIQLVADYVEKKQNKGQDDFTPLIALLILAIIMSS